MPRLKDILFDNQSENARGDGSRRDRVDARIFLSEVKLPFKQGDKVRTAEQR